MTRLTSILAQADTIPGDSGGPYVIAAYVVFLVVVVVYVAIMAQRLQRIAKIADDLQARLDGVDHGASQGAGAVQGGAVDDVTAPTPTIAPKQAGAPAPADATTAGGPSA